MKSKPKKGEREIRSQTRLTRPPRLEGKVKNAGINPVRKLKQAHAAARIPKKVQGYMERERKDYQLRSSKH